MFKASNSRVVHGFQAFYYELLRQKEICLSKFFSETEAGTDGGKDSLEVESIIVAVQKKLITSIEKAFEITAEKLGNSNRIRDAKYIMAVLSDEIFINLRWDGAKFWRLTLLEKQIFQSEIAGERFFTMLDDAISEQHNVDEEMAFLYFMALSLGFKGKYRDSENSEAYISWYREKLHSMLHKKPAGLFYPGRPAMIESCYESTITDKGKETIPDTRFWTYCILGIIFVYIVVSYAVWFGITGEISDILNDISEQIRRGPLV